ncbi:receptor-type tyrosine-protein phosphatase epsilon-like isoform X2 [Babylonia areolata]|uniref:receptor-type tyrosine-protein phosphatase epsilon-like isoform X2 n=1 Tax=Babylonia areolata TaxID=304850 RepID=UPI003FCFE3E7
MGRWWPWLVIVVWTTLGVSVTSIGEEDTSLTASTPPPPPTTTTTTTTASTDINAAFPSSGNTTVLSTGPPSTPSPSLEPDDNRELGAIAENSTTSEDSVSTSPTPGSTAINITSTTDKFGKDTEPSSPSSSEDEWPFPPGMEWVLLGVLIFLIVVAFLIAVCLLCKQHNIKPWVSRLAPNADDDACSNEEEGTETGVCYTDLLPGSEEDTSARSTNTNKPIKAVKPLKNASGDVDAAAEGEGDHGTSTTSSPSKSRKPQAAPRRKKDLRIPAVAAAAAEAGEMRPGKRSEESLLVVEEGAEGERRVRKSVYSVLRQSLADLDPVQAYLVDRLEIGQLLDDFKSIPVTISGYSSDDSVLQENKKKNRFASVLPYDKNRVVLTDGYTEEEATDYVNASFIDGYHTEKAYIAAQGPKETTAGDFWRMIWQEKVTALVMLTNLRERGRDKCHQYWPELVGEKEVYGPVTVTTHGVETRATFTVRHFSVTSTLQEGETREVTQYHYVSWPDFGVPLTASLVSFWRFVTRKRAEGGGQGSPILVHCSAGVGRSGTFIGLDIAMQQSVAEKHIDVMQLVTSLRHQRCLMVQAVSQFEFLHTALLEAYTSRDSVFQMEDVWTKLTSPVRALQPHAGIDREFKMLMEMKALSDELSCFIAKQGDNKEKNRDPKLLPADDHIVFLTEPVEDRGDYINAVFMPTFYDPHGSIVTQLPLPSTVIDFWRLVYGNDVSTVVSITSLDDQEVTPPCQYWPLEEEQEMDVDPYTIRLRSVSTVCPSLLVYTLCLSKKGETKPRELQLLHYQGWDGQTGGDVDDVFHIIDTLMTLPSSEAYVVQCTDGVRRSGLFCALCDVIARMTYDEEVDVYMSVRHIQSVSPRAVSSVIQYRYIYEAVQYRCSQMNPYVNEVPPLRCLHPFSPTLQSSSASSPPPSPTSM